jgi:hypothetical protein
VKRTWNIDSATGDLFENDVRVGSLITGSSGAYLRLIEAANGCPLENGTG